MNSESIVQSEKDNPVITVLMSVYNGEQYLREAIDSIHGQLLVILNSLLSMTLRRMVPMTSCALIKTRESELSSTTKTLA